MKKRKIILISSISLIGASIIVSGSITLAGYVATSHVTQTTSTLGRAKTSIFLNADFWDTDSPVYVMHVWKDGGSGSLARDLLASKQNIAGYYVFEFDTTIYDRLIFYRCDPTDFNLSSLTIWNQTDNITYTYGQSTNLFTINSWKISSSNTHSGYTLTTYSV